MNNIYKKSNHFKSSVYDYGASIIPISLSSQIAINNALLIVAFPGPGMIGSIVSEQLIEQLRMHQVAYVHSQYILPGVLWVGGRLRHPFRVYATADGSICLLTCDVLVNITAIDHISSAITKWCDDHHIIKLLVVSGIYPENLSPFPEDIAKRVAFVIENDSNSTNVVDIDTKAVGRVPKFAFIAGLPGQLLANCVVQSIHCTAILVPTLISSPDPEGGAVAIEAIAKLIPAAKLSSAHLKHQAELIKARLTELAKLQYRLEKNNLQREHEGTEQIYK